MPRIYSKPTESRDWTISRLDTFVAPLGLAVTCGFILFVSHPTPLARTVTLAVLVFSLIVLIWLGLRTIFRQ